jgi:uncharacterized protein YebE (UPF0316 family)
MNSDFLQIITTPGFNWYAWVVLPIIIFIARISDVTLGTLRIIFISRGRRNLAPILGFFEVLIWIVVIGQLVQNLHSASAYVAYAGGFAAGNFVGLWLEDRIAIGTYILRVMISEGGELLAEKIHQAGFGVTQVEGKGAVSSVKILYTIVKRKHVSQVMKIIHNSNPNAFVTIEEVRSTEKGIFPSNVAQENNPFFGRKSK